MKKPLISPRLASRQGTFHCGKAAAGAVIEQSTFGDGLLSVAGSAYRPVGTRAWSSENQAIWTDRLTIVESSCVQDARDKTGVSVRSCPGSG